MCSLFRNKNGTRIIDGHVDLKLSIDYAFVHVFYIFMKTNTTITDNKFEWCSSYANLPFHVHFLFDVVKQYTINLFHECPFAANKTIGIQNCPIDINPTILNVLKYQLGDYKTGVRVTDKNGKSIFFLNLYTKISRKRLQKGSKNMKIVN